MIRGTTPIEYSSSRVFQLMLLTDAWIRFCLLYFSKTSHRCASGFMIAPGSHLPRFAKALHAPTLLLIDLNLIVD